MLVMKLVWYCEIACMVELKVTHKEFSSTKWIAYCDRSSFVVIVMGPYSLSLSDEAAFFFFFFWLLKK